MARATLVGEQAKSQGGVQLDTSEVVTQFLCPLTGKTLYRKTVDCGLLLNGAKKSTAHGISNLNLAEGAVCKIDGCISDGAKQENILLAALVSVVEVDGTNVDITSTGDLTSSRAIVWLEYSKT